MRNAAYLLAAVLLLVAWPSAAPAHIGMAAFSRVLVVDDQVSVTMILPADHVSVRSDSSEALYHLGLAATAVTRGGVACRGHVRVAESRRDADILRLAMAFVCEAPGRIDLTLAAVGSLAGFGLQYVEVQAEGRTEGFLRTQDGAVSFEAEQLGRPNLLLAYFALGAEHVLLGLDHLAFLLALWLSARTLGHALALATTFAACHSLTLALGALDYVRADMAFVEPIIALSIAAAAIEGMVQGPSALKLAIAGGFGLVHGLGFAGGLREAGLPNGNEMAALAAFTLGIEAAQVGLLLLAAPLLRRAAEAKKLLRAGGAALTALGLGWFVLRVAGG